MEDLSDYRKSYDKNQLLESEIPNDPFLLFKKWFQEVETSNEIIEVNAMTVASIGLDGFPKSRVVLLKKYDAKGFVFYTNYNSEKGKAIQANPNVCLSFFWEKFERQVIIKGVASKTSQAQSNEYFDSRPPGSKLGAIVSNQSEIIASRTFLEEKLSDLEQKLENKTISRPENWGGFLVQPIEIEFWQGRPNRLHDRIRFKLDGYSIWKTDRLSP
jgi:pyridoxamine 5'-phosphate oxidase